MTGEYQDNYSDSMSGEGREIRISDGTINYYYDFPAGDTLDDAATSFAASYDHNGIAGAVRCYAEEYMDGEQVGARYYFCVESCESCEQEQA